LLTNLLKLIESQTSLLGTMKELYDRRKTKRTRPSPEEISRSLEAELNEGPGAVTLHAQVKMTLAILLDLGGDINAEELLNRDLMHHWSLLANVLRSLLVRVRYLKKTNNRERSFSDLF